MKESMDHSLALHVPRRNLNSKLDASEAVRREFQFESCLLLSELNEKDRAIELAKVNPIRSIRSLPELDNNL